MAQKRISRPQIQSMDKQFTKNILDRIPGMVVVYNLPNGEFRYVNKSIKHLLGYTAEELLTGGFDFSDSLIHPDDLPAIIAQTKKAIDKANNKPSRGEESAPIVTLEYRVKHKNGTWRWFHTDGIVFDRDAKGQILHVVNISIDITKRREAELREADARKEFEQKMQHFASIVTSSDDAIISKTLDGIITSWNKSASVIFGWSAKEAIGKHITLIIPPELRSEEEKIIRTLKQGKHIHHYETVRVTKSGKHIHVSISISPLKDDDGNIIGASKIARDITQRKRYEDVIARSQERLELAVEAGRIGIWDWDIVNNNIHWTDRVYEIHGIRKGTTVGELDKYRQRHHPEDAARVKLAIEQALNGEKPYREEFRIITPAGKTRWVETRAIVIRDGVGNPIRMLGATTDVTERKNLQQQKDEFIGIASHELKTPVTSIKAYTQLLESKFRKEGHEKSAELLTKANAQLDKLTGLISDLLDVTKIETGQLEYKEQLFDFNALVKETVDQIQMMSPKHKISTNFGPAKKVYADRDRVGQVLTNFLTNAVKYSPHGDTITVTTTVVDNAVNVAVRDYGIGIHKDLKDKVFERFFRVETSSGQTFPGMGLGLYISSQIIKAQSGKIWVNSTPGKGSTFSFSLPLKRTTKKV